MKRKYLWPTALIVCGVLMVFFGVASNVGWIDVPLYKVVCAVPLVAFIAVKGIIERRFYTIPIPFAALFLLFEEYPAKWAGVESGDLISNWIVIVAAICIFIGLAFITVFRKNDRSEDSFATKKTKNHISSSVKYINCADFTHETVECDMGSCKIFFSNTSEYAGTGTLKLHCNMGSVLVTVPKEWKIETNIDKHMGSVNIDENNASDDAKVLKIVGENNMGAIHVKFS